jgi:Kef-type K+ transport system membrane component KefB
MITVDSESFLAVVSVAALAALIGGLAGRRVLVPVVAVEIVLGILIGPEVLGLAKPDEFLDFFASLGLGMLFFFAGYEIEFGRIRGSPLRLAALGWLLSLALAYALAGFLVVRGAPAMVLYRRTLDLRDRAALAFFSATQLPLVVAITTIAVERGHMRSGTAASLVAAGILSTVIYPFVGLGQRAHRAVEAAS